MADSGFNPSPNDLAHMEAHAAAAGAADPSNGGSAAAFDSYGSGGDRAAKMPKHAPAAQTDAEQQLAQLQREHAQLKREKEADAHALAAERQARIAADEARKAADEARKAVEEALEPQMAREGEAGVAKAMAMVASGEAFASGKPEVFTATGEQALTLPREANPAGKIMALLFGCMARLSRPTARPTWRKRMKPREGEDPRRIAQHTRIPTCSSLRDWSTPLAFFTNWRVASRPRDEGDGRVDWRERSTSSQTSRSRA